MEICVVLTDLGLQGDFPDETIHGVSIMLDNDCLLAALASLHAEKKRPPPDNGKGRHFWSESA